MEEKRLNFKQLTRLLIGGTSILREVFDSIHSLVSAVQQSSEQAQEVQFFLCGGGGAGNSPNIYWSQKINGRICCSIGLYPSKLDIVFNEERGGGERGLSLHFNLREKMCLALFCFVVVVVVVVVCIKHLTNLLSVGLHTKKGLRTKQITFPIGDSCNANKGNRGEGCGGVGHSRRLPATRLFFPIQKVWAGMADHPN